MKRLFITGTDTEIGKTWVACALTRHLVSRGLKVAVMKPVASGCIRTEEGLRNEDALKLMAESNVSMPYHDVNPYAYEPAIAPHIAAAQTGMFPDVSRLARIAGGVTADFLLIEGVGGWNVPLSDGVMLPDLVRALGAEVVLVVGMKLGCINHALLSAGQIRAQGFRLSGWIANQCDSDMPCYEENRETLRKLLDTPMICEVSWQGGIAGSSIETMLN